MADYGEVRRWEDLERWGQRLTALADCGAFRNEVFHLREAIGAFNAMKVYGRAESWHDLERWGCRLINLFVAEPFGSDLAIRLWQCKAANNAIHHYCLAKQRKGVERWGQWLVDLASLDSTRKDPAFRVQEVMGAKNSLLFYNRIGLQGTPAARRWRDRIINAVRDFPHHPEINRLAHELGLNSAELFARAGHPARTIFSRIWRDGDV